MRTGNERTTSCILLPELYPDGRIVFLQKDLSHENWRVWALVCLGSGVVVMCIGALHVIDIGAGSEGVLGWALLAITLFAFGAALMGITYLRVPVHRSLVIDPSRGQVGLRESRKGRVVAEYVRAMEDCRFVRGFMGDTKLKSIDRVALLCCVPSDQGEMHVVLIGGAQDVVDEYIALLPKVIRDRVVVSSDSFPARLSSGGRKAMLIMLQVMKRCRQCGYSLGGLESVRCPECGRGRWKDAA